MRVTVESGIGEATARIIAAAGELPQAAALTCDITNEAAVRDVFRSIPALDILINNAGIGMVGSIEETEPLTRRSLLDDKVRHSSSIEVAIGNDR